MVINAPPETLINALPGVSAPIEWLESKWNAATEMLQSLPTNISGFSGDLISSAREKYYNTQASPYVGALKQALSGYRSVDYHTSIHYASDYESMVSAAPVMQEYILHAPSLHPYVESNVLDTWDTTREELGYIPDREWEEQPTVKRVNNGLARQDIFHQADGSFLTLDRVTEWFDDDVDDEPDLSINERVKILRTWDKVDELVKDNYDPTSMIGSKL